MRKKNINQSFANFLLMYQSTCTEGNPKFKILEVKLDSFFMFIRIFVCMMIIVEKFLF